MGCANPREDVEAVRSCICLCRESNRGHLTPYQSPILWSPKEADVWWMGWRVRIPWRTCLCTTNGMSAFYWTKSKVKEDLTPSHDSLNPIKSPPPQRGGVGALRQAVANHSLDWYAPSHSGGKNRSISRFFWQHRIKARVKQLSRCFCSHCYNLEHLSVSPFFYFYVCLRP
jgi:hypothetical protein